jgi:hypothetical protein
MNRMRMLLFVVGFVLLCLFGWRWTGAVDTSLRLSCATVDVVYTYVNGSDPVHLESLRQTDNQDEEPGRFRDYDVLRFSLRSVQAFFPLARLVHIVIADGEAVPWWLNVSDSRIRVVRHSHIMPKTALPTFNSNAIESNLHLIPGLADCFVYLNDDMLFGRLQDSLDYYWDVKRGKQRVHFGTWLAPMLDRAENNVWHRAVARTNDEISRFYGTEARLYPLHGCYFFNKHIFAEMRKRFEESFEETLHTTFRSENDMVLSFVYPHFAVMEFGA